MWPFLFLHPLHCLVCSMATLYLLMIFTKELFNQKLNYSFNLFWLGYESISNACPAVKFYLGAILIVYDW